MSQENHNLYEGMYIISARLSDDARSKALTKITDGITSHGGEIEKIHEMGRRRLAYEIDGHREGHYYVVYFKVDASAVKEMWSEYHLSEDLIRFITLTTDKVKEKLEFKSLVEQK
jgi:small subunit ribosomal protein S6